MKLLKMALFLLLLAGAASASEQSERLYSQGLIDFHAGQYDEALRQFDAAVAADPNDPYARYYRGVTRGRIRDFEGAAVDLQAVLEARPAMNQAALELGVALVEKGAYADSVKWLEQAQQAQSLEAEASFYLGLAHLRLGDLDQAQQNFDRAAAAKPQLALSTRYYQGLIAYQSGDLEKAEANFKQVATSSPNSEMGVQANRFLARIQGGDASAGPEKLYSVFGAVGFQYDSNVPLAPDDEQIKSSQGISNQGDGRATILAGGTISPWRSKHAWLTLGYEFFQSLHFNLNQYNLQDHRPVVQIGFDYSPLRFGLQTRYDYYLQQTDSFLQQGLVVPWFSADEGAWTRTDLSGRFRYRDFLDEPDSPVLDGFNYSALIRQYLHLGSRDRYLFVGYRFDYEDPSNHSGERYSYDGNEVNAGGGAMLPSNILLQLEYAYRNEHYADHASDGRIDNEQLVGLSLSRTFLEHYDVTLAYFGDFNDSNQGDFQYQRNVGSISFGVRF